MSSFNQSEKNEIHSILELLEGLPQTSKVINISKRCKAPLGIKSDNYFQVVRLTEVVPITRISGVQRLIIAPKFR